MSEVTKQIMDVKWSYQRQGRGKRESGEQVNERTKQNVKAKSSYLSNSKEVSDQLAIQPTKQPSNQTTKQPAN